MILMLLLFGTEAFQIGWIDAAGASIVQLYLGGDRRR